MKRRDNTAREENSLEVALSKLSIDDKRAISKEINKLLTGQQRKDHAKAKANTHQTAKSRKVQQPPLSIGDKVEILNPNNNEPTRGKVVRIRKRITVQPKNHRKLVRARHNIRAVPK